MPSAPRFKSLAQALHSRAETTWPRSPGTHLRTTLASWSIRMAARPRRTLVLGLQYGLGNRSSQGALRIKSDEGETGIHGCLDSYSFARIAYYLFCTFQMEQADVLYCECNDTPRKTVRHRRCARLADKNHTSVIPGYRRVPDYHTDPALARMNPCRPWLASESVENPMISRRRSSDVETWAIWEWVGLYGVVEVWILSASDYRIGAWIFWREAKYLGQSYRGSVRCGS